MKKATVTKEVLARESLKKVLGIIGEVFQICVDADAAPGNIRDGGKRIRLEGRTNGGAEMSYSIAAANVFEIAEGLEQISDDFCVETEVPRCWEESLGYGASVSGDQAVEDLEAWEDSLNALMWTVRFAVDNYANRGLTPEDFEGLSLKIQDVLAEMS